MMNFKLTLYVVIKLLKNSKKQEKVLGAIIDFKLKFTTHLLNITKSADGKSTALPRIQKCMIITRTLSGTLINANLGHSKLIYPMLTNVACKFS